MTVINPRLFYAFALLALIDAQATSLAPAQSVAAPSFVDCSLSPEACAATNAVDVPKLPDHIGLAIDDRSA